jgi:hypothetical protein
MNGSALYSLLGSLLLSPLYSRFVCRMLLAASVVGGLVGCVSSAADPKGLSPTKPAPRLEVVIDCGACEVKDSVVGVIREGYANAAARAGAPQLSGGTATLTVKTYSQRGFGTRFLIGPLGILFADAIRAELVFEGRTVQVAESARVPFQGIEAVARRLGEKALESLRE